jgi:hypothetical protein
MGEPTLVQCRADVKAKQITGLEDFLRIREAAFFHFCFRRQGLYE